MPNDYNTTPGWKGSQPRIKDESYDPAHDSITWTTVPWAKDVVQSSDPKNTGVEPGAHARDNDKEIPAEEPSAPASSAPSRYSGSIGSHRSPVREDRPGHVESPAHNHSPEHGDSPPHKEWQTRTQSRTHNYSAACGSAKHGESPESRHQTPTSETYATGRKDATVLPPTTPSARTTPDDDRRTSLENGSNNLHMILEAIAADSERFTNLFYIDMLAHDFTLLKLFPASMPEQRSLFLSELLRILTTLDDMTDHPEHVENLLQLLERIGRDHRKFGLAGEHYGMIAKAFAASAKKILGTRWNKELEELIRQSFDTCGSVMLRAASTLTEPVSVSATVLEVRHITRDLSIIRLQSDADLNFKAGQYLSIQIPQAKGAWRNFSPSIPPNPDGLVEFHIRTVQGGYVSGRAVKSTQVGDEWILSTPTGHLCLDPSLPALMIAGGTGLAPLRALILDNIGDNPDVPIDLYYGARYPGELYDLPNLNAIAFSYPRLTLHPSADETTNPWWMRDVPPLPQSLPVHHGSMLDEVVSDGLYRGRQILVAGSPAMIRETVSRLTSAGVPNTAICYDRFSN